MTIKLNIKLQIFNCLLLFTFHNILFIYLCSFLCPNKAIWCSFPSSIKKSSTVLCFCQDPCEHIYLSWEREELNITYLNLLVIQHRGSNTVCECVSVDETHRCPIVFQWLAVSCKNWWAFINASHNDRKNMTEMYLSHWERESVKLIRDQLLRATLFCRCGWPKQDVCRGYKEKFICKVWLSSKSTWYQTTWAFIYLMGLHTLDGS